jgi:hypothetical protein
MPSSNTTLIGTTFPTSSQWHIDETLALATIKKQIEQYFPTSNNLIINTTWFGPQFEGSDYAAVLQMAEENIQISNIFFVSMVDEIMLLPEQIQDIGNKFNANVYCLGNFDNKYQFTFISTTLPKYFVNYTKEEVELKDFTYLFLCYNRKPREHRSALVKKILDSNLEKYGVISLGINDSTYSKTDKNISILLGETPEQFAKEGNWGNSMDFGIPHDIHSLGNMEIWSQHFLNIVGETIFNPWDNMFITEKTWKPILGLRPFVINGQTKIYKYLRDNGFKTFNHYFNGIELEKIPEYKVHDSIVSVIQYLSTLDKQEILDMYNDMLPDLIHNRNRFFEFAREQQYLIENIFNE